MVSFGVSVMEKPSFVFVPPGSKANRPSDEVCCLSFKRHCGCHNWTFWTTQQDEVPSHTARNNINFLIQENVTFIEPDKWSPNSPDLNPVDCAKRVYCKKINLRRIITAVEQFKLPIIEELSNLVQRFIRFDAREHKRVAPGIIKKSLRNRGN